MLRTVVYIRKSTKDKDEKQVHSLPRQFGDITEFLARYNSVCKPEEKLSFDPEKDLFQEDASAKRPWRRRFWEMIRAIEKNKYDVLLCHELSRLSRNPIDTWVLVTLLDKPPSPSKLPPHLRQIRTLTNIFANTPTDTFTLSLFLSVAKFENDQRAINTSSGMQRQKKKGVTTNKAPMGYKNNPGGRKGKKTVSRDGDNFTMLQGLWYQFATWSYTVSEIARMGSEMGVTTIESYKDGERRTVPSESSYRSMFENSYYSGWITDKDGTSHKGEHEAMVDNETFDAVQLLLQKRGYKHAKLITAFSYENILKGILICGKTNESVYVDVKSRFTCPHCKYRFYSAALKPCPKCSHTFSEKEGRHEVYKYYCFPKGVEHEYKWKGEVKRARNIPSEYIESLVDDEISKLSISDELFTLLKGRLYGMWLEKWEQSQKYKKELQKEIEILEERRRKNRASLIEKQNSLSQTEQEDIEATIALFDKEIIELKNKKDEIDELDTEWFEVAWQLLNTLLSAKKFFGEKGESSLEPKRRLILSMVTNHKFLDGKIITEWKKPFDIVASAGLTKQKSQNESEIFEWDLKWLPE